MKQEFDANQGHGDHMDCLCGPGNTNEFLPLHHNAKTRKPENTGQV